MEQQLNARDLDQILGIMEDVIDVAATGDPGAAPVIDLWAPVALGGYFRLWGQVTGHPRGLDDDVMTSSLFYLDKKTGLARTRSRWYRLRTYMRDSIAYPPGVCIFGPYCREVAVEEAASIINLYPDLLLMDARRLGDDEQIRRAAAVRDSWPV